MCLVQGAERAVPRQSLCRGTLMIPRAGPTRNNPVPGDGDTNTSGSEEEEGVAPDVQGAGEGVAGVAGVPAAGVGLGAGADAPGAGVAGTAVAGAAVAGAPGIGPPSAGRTPVAKYCVSPKQLKGTP